jgi:predicted kinase
LKAIVTVGLPACGKSTYARRLEKAGWDVLERDRIRQEIMMEREQEFSWEAWDLIDEDEVTQRFEARLTWLIQQRRSFIISDTNLNESRRSALVGLLRDKGVDVSVVLFDVPFRDLRARNAARGGFAVPYSAWVRLIPLWKAASARCRENRMIRVTQVPAVLAAA